MKEAFKMVSLQQDRTKACSFDFLNRETVESIRDFHKSFPMYQPTPLACLKDTAAELGLGAMYVKDESYRFGLNAFKVLGGSYAIGHYLANRLGKPMKEVDFPTLVSDETRKELGDVTFVTATDGNHGRGVAWTARQFQQKAVVYMPKGSAAERLANIQAEGADASITDLNYDDAVRLANSQDGTGGGNLPDPHGKGNIFHPLGHQLRRNVRPGNLGDDGVSQLSHEGL